MVEDRNFSRIYVIGCCTMANRRFAFRRHGFSIVRCGPDERGCPS